MAAVYDLAQQETTFRIHRDFREVLSNCSDAACVAVDIPIGLADREARRCDLEARRVLGPRRSSVFPAPDFRVLEAVIAEGLDYSGASALSHLLLGKGISRQAFAIYPKVAEVNQVMTPALQQRVIEVHPEVSFWSLANWRPMEHPKRTREGFEERRNHLSRVFGGVHVPERQEARRIARPAKADDVLDALVAAWSANRFAEGGSGRLPSEPSTDPRGLRMEIVH